MTIVETSLLKAYLLENNNILVNALLRSENNCCLPSEVEKDLKKHNLIPELISFYEKQQRHSDALELLTKTQSVSSEKILNYLMKLDSQHLQLIFNYVRPMIESSLNQKEKLFDILRLFIGEPTSASPSSTDATPLGTFKLNPIEVYEFLKSISVDFSILYLENICFKPELGPKQREIHNRLVYAYCDQIKSLSKKFRPMIKDKKQTEIFQGKSN